MLLLSPKPPLKLSLLFYKREGTHFKVFRKDNGNEYRIKTKHKESQTEDQRIKMQRKMLTLAKIFCDCGSYFKFTYWSSASLHICKCKWMCTSEKLGNLESSWREDAFEGLRSLGCLSPASDSRGLPFAEVLLVTLTVQPTRYLRSIKPYTLLFIYSLLLS